MTQRKEEQDAFSRQFCSDDDGRSTPRGHDRSWAAHKDDEGRRVDPLAAAVRLTKMATASTGDEELDQMAHSVAVAHLARCT